MSSRHATSNGSKPKHSGRSQSQQQQHRPHRRGGMPGGGKAGKPQQHSRRGGQSSAPPATAPTAGAPAAAPELCSRVCIKNLPEKYTNDKLRAHCQAAVGPVTDVKIMHKNGVSRKFAFVGFETPEAAARAVKGLNRTFIQTSRISVEFARRIGAPVPGAGGGKGGAAAAAARPWSKYSVGSSKHRELHPEQYANEDEEAVKKKKKRKNKVSQNGKGGDGAGSGEGEGTPSSDPAASISDKKLLEFLRVFVPKKGKSWANDDLVLAAAHEQQGREVPSSGEEEEEDDDDDGAHDDDGGGGGGGSGKGGATKAVGGKGGDGGEGTDDGGGGVDLSATGRLFVRNLPFNVEEDELDAAFRKFGKLSELHLPRDAQQRVKGFAFVAYARPEHAIRAHGAMDGRVFHGRILHVLPARQREVPEDPNQSKGAAGSGSGGDSYKAKKQAELRKSAEDKDVWATLFIRSDTAVGVIAEQMGLGKSDILDRESTGSMAVRAALSETHVVQQTKRLLEEEGVNLEALERAARGDAAAAAAPRSKRVILAKNLPFAATKDEFAELFAPFGQTLRLVFPAVRTIALVEFVNPSSAKAAFRKLAYKKFKHVPLYLEWAPRDIFGDEQPAGGAVSAPSSKHRAAADDDGGEAGAGANGGADDSSTLFVKNLNFDTTRETLEAAFKRRATGVRSATIVTRTDKKRGVLSTGYGFVEFSSPAHVVEALKKLQGLELDGHVLELKFSRNNHAGSESKATKKRKRPAAPAAAAAAAVEGATTAAAGGDDGSAGKKLLVKNLAFESSNRELRQLFGSFGQLKSVRMPRKFDGGHRGFAFVEYTSHKDARAAMEELANTHFYGRHLVVDWAKETGGVEDARLQSQKDAASIKARRADKEAADAMSGGGGGNDGGDEWGL